MLAAMIEKHWYKASLTWLTLLLLPLSLLYRLIVSLRRKLYQTGLFQSEKLRVPVIVVGNITVGGTGKTPFVIWLVSWLQENGYHPGVISRGYGSSRHENPFDVQSDSCAKLSGDEALLITRKTNVPVIIYHDRVKAAKHLLGKYRCNILISDDGLQHYRLHRDLEICLINGEVGLGNKHMLPAGPLREPVSRLSSVDYIVSNKPYGSQSYSIEYQYTQFISLSDASKQCNPSVFSNTQVHAVAGIAHPERFFNALKQLDMHVVEHRYPDHYQFKQDDLLFSDHHPVVMSGKDAVKCESFAQDNVWYLDVEVVPDVKMRDMLLSTIRRIEHAYQLKKEDKVYR